MVRGKKDQLTDAQVRDAHKAYLEDGLSLQECSRQVGITSSSLNQRFQKLGLRLKAKLRVGENDLASQDPELAKQFDREKNGGLGPESFAVNSNKAVWWLCGLGHSWSALINNRRKTKLCPICINRKVLAGYNDLATTHPSLAAEWHVERNLPLTAQEITYGSDKLRWWLCSFGHEWKVAPNSRSQFKTGCPVCAGQRAVPGEGSLAKLRPELISLYDMERNTVPFEDLQIQSNRRMAWRCSFGHGFEARAADIVKRAEPCPTCSGKRVLSGFNDLGTTHPYLQSEWSERNEVGIDTLSYGSATKRWWRCRKGHEYQTSPSKRTMRGDGCPKCGNRASAMEARLYTELLPYFSDVRWGSKVGGREVDIYLPTLSLGIEVDGYPWHMDKAESEARKDRALQAAGVDILRIRDDRLPTYQGSQILVKDPSQSNAETLRAVSEVMAFVRARDPESLLPPALTEFSNEALFLDVMANLSVAGGKSLLDESPGSVEAWDAVKNGRLGPKDVAPHSIKSVWWKCGHGHSYEATPNYWTQGGRCNICAGFVLLSGFNDAESKYPVLKRLYSSDNPVPMSQVLPRVATEWNWRCEEGHTWSARVSDMVKLAECPQCKEQNASNGTLARKYPAIFSELAEGENADVDLERLSPGSDKKLKWICQHGHVYEMTPYHRTSRGQGCSQCSGRRPITGVNDLATKFPGIAAEWHPNLNGDIRPTGVKYGSGKVVWWRCQHGHPWQASVTARTANNQTKGCPTCKDAAQSLLPGF